MVRNQNTRIQPQVLKADEEAFLTLKTISSYRPANPAYTIAALNAKYIALRSAQESEQNALSAAGDTAVAAAWDFHNAMLGAKDQVMAQYGPNSSEAVVLGLRKKLERRTTPRGKLGV